MDTTRRTDFEERLMVPEEGAPEVSIIVPAINEAHDIGAVLDRIHRVMEQTDHRYEILVVDDGSTDATAKNAAQAGARVIQHPYNIGNGAAIKTGIRNAQGRVLVMLDADGQHPPEDITRLLDELQTHHMVVGARTRASDASAHRTLANRIYNRFAGYVCGRKIDDLTSGFRAIYTHIAREFIPLLPNTFSYPTTITLATVRSGFSLTYVPVVAPGRQEHGKSKIKPVRDGARFFLIIFKIATLFSPMKIFLPVSLVTFVLGLAYGLYRIFALDTRYGPTSSMLMAMAALMFLIGLLSEQISQLKFDRRVISESQPRFRLRSRVDAAKTKSVELKELE
jgi:glycosyltransferase involved in cell wall biosynthesis